MKIEYFFHKFENYAKEQQFIDANDSLQNSQDFEHIMAQYGDPLTGKQLRALAKLCIAHQVALHLSKWGTQYLEKDKYQDYAAEQSIIFSFAGLGYFDEAIRLTSMIKDDFRANYPWSRIVIELAQQNLFQEATEIADKQLTHVDFYEIYAKIILAQHMEIAKHPNADTYLQAAIEAVDKYWVPLSTALYSDEHSAIRNLFVKSLVVCDKFELALGQIEQMAQYRFAVESYCAIARKLGLENGGRELLDKAIELTNKKSKFYEHPTIDWRFDSLSEIALTMYELGDKRYVSILDRIYKLIDGDTIAYFHRDNAKCSLIELLVKLNFFPAALKLAKTISSRPLELEMYARIAELIHKTHPQTSVSLFKYVLKCLLESREHITTRRPIALSLARTGQYSIATKIFVSEREKKRTIEEIAQIMAHKGQLTIPLQVQAFSTRSHFTYILQDFCFYGRFCEAIEEGIWIEIIQDILKIFSWFNSEWEETLQAIE